MEGESPSTNRFVSRLVWLGVGALGLVLIASVATPAVRRMMAEPPEPHPAPAADQPPPHWSGEQVGELIDEIQESRTLGLEPKDYGLAALRGELDRRGGPTVREGSIQLDRLAETSALNLAEDLSRRGMADHGQYDWHAEEGPRDPGLVAGLHGALARSRVGAWLHGLRASAPQLSANSH